MNTVSHAGDPIDPLFYWIQSHILETQGIRLAIPDLQLLYYETLEHVSYLVEHLGSFWEVARVRDMDLTKAERLPYAILFSRGAVSQETMGHWVRLQILTMNKTVAEVLNHFFHFLVDMLKEHVPKLAK